MHRASIVVGRYGKVTYHLDPPKHYCQSCGLSASRANNFSHCNDMWAAIDCFCFLGPLFCFVLTHQHSFLRPCVFVSDKLEFIHPGGLRRGSWGDGWTGHGGGCGGGSG